MGLSWGIQDLVPWPGNEPRPPALEVWSLSHWKSPIIHFHYIRVPLCSRDSHGKNTGAVCHSLLIGKDPDYGKDWRQKERTTEHEIVKIASWAPGTWIWANSGRQWRSEKPGMLQSTEVQSQTHLATEPPPALCTPFYLLSILCC